MEGIFSWLTGATILCITVVAFFKRLKDRGWTAIP